jgi:hypothetical protein
MIWSSAIVVSLLSFLSLHRDGFSVFVLRALPLVDRKKNLFSVNFHVALIYKFYDTKIHVTVNFEEGLCFWYDDEGTER